MNNFITYKGIIHFDPVDKTKKHKNQSNWKRIAMVLIDGDLCEYYAWFIKKRYNLELNKPIRGAHITFLNDSVTDILKGLKCTENELEVIWESVKKKWEGVEIDVVLDLDVRGNVKHWWLNIPNEHRGLLHDIRSELGLDRPYFGLHLSIGYANNKNIQHSEYIINCIQKGLIT